LTLPSLLFAFLRRPRFVFFLFLLLFPHSAKEKGVEKGTKRNKANWDKENTRFINISLIGRWGVV
jgi:hypothetical protein